ncbi:hypothetical protein HPB52_012924 [Rhipicephalus sanguineus]|uniref:CRAL/TRIO N-terminal domain-containing protein n=1 Tax=Rhipicephalus sanguineus TaxID=34632 RepID=A0A9D4T3P7_RHISA|nr:hypothetical protein HPB52_012924 [Rhipicephalus sanguineus]
MEEELEVAAREELGETPELRKESVDKFRELLQEETDLRPPPDYVLLMFLRARKYNMDNAMKSLKAFFRIRTKLPEYYDNHLPSALDYQTVVREHKLLMLSKDRDSQGRAVGLKSLLTTAAAFEETRAAEKVLIAVLESEATSTAIYSASRVKFVTTVAAWTSEPWASTTETA